MYATAYNLFVEHYINCRLVDGSYSIEVVVAMEIRYLIDRISKIVYVSTGITEH